MNRDLEFAPLPYYPFDSRPDSIPLDVEECRTAIYLAHGDLTQAAALLKVPVAKLRRLVRQVPRLQREIQRSGAPP